MRERFFVIREKICSIMPVELQSFVAKKDDNYLIISFIKNKEKEKIHFNKGFRFRNVLIN